MYDCFDEFRKKFDPLNRSISLDQFQILSEDELQRLIQLSDYKTSWDDYQTINMFRSGRKCS
jgi:hypothetical protein